MGGGKYGITKVQIKILIWALGMTTHRYGIATLRSIFWDEGIASAILS